jgi:hypothetical protein
VIAAERVQRTGSVAAVVTAIHESPLDALDGGDPGTSLRTAFSWSYTALGQEAAGLFRALGALPAGVDTDHPALDRLVAANLVSPHGLHGLRHRYAAELATLSTVGSATVPTVRSAGSAKVSESLAW